MRTLQRVAAGTVSALAASAIAACSSSSTGLPEYSSSPMAASGIAVAGKVVAASQLQRAQPHQSQTNRNAEPAAGGETLYLSLAEGTVYNGFRPPKHKPSCASGAQLQTIVNSIGVDAGGMTWLPVAIVGQPSEVRGYAPGCGALQTTLSLPANADPSGIAFGSDGTKYVLNNFINTTSGFNSASVSVYAPGATMPTATLTDARLDGEEFVSDGIGIDAAGSVYVTCCAQTAQPFAIMFSGSGDQTSGTQIPLAQMTKPGGAIIFDKAHDMIVPDLGDTTLKVYAPPYDGSPTSLPLRGQPWQCALSKNQRKVACTNFFKSTADIYAYPSMNLMYHLKIASFASIPVLGIAYYP